MKKSVRFSAVFLSGLAFSGMTFAEGFNASIQGAISNYKTTTLLGDKVTATGDTLVLTGGVKFSDYFGLEGEVTKSLRDATYSQRWSATQVFTSNTGYGTITCSPCTEETSVSYMTAGAYVLLSFPIGEKVSLRARGGARYINADTTKVIKGDYSGTHFYELTANSTSTGGTYGVGMTWKLGEKSALKGDYTVISSDLSHIAFGWQMTF